MLSPERLVPQVLLVLEILQCPSVTLPSDYVHYTKHKEIIRLAWARQSFYMHGHMLLLGQKRTGFQYFIETWTFLKVRREINKLIKRQVCELWCNSCSSSVTKSNMWIKKRSNYVWSVKRFSCNKADWRRRFSAKTKGKSRLKERGEQHRERACVAVSH